MTSVYSQHNLPFHEEEEEKAEMIDADELYHTSTKGGEEVIPITFPPFEPSKPQAIPVKQKPQFWKCSICTFIENPVNEPLCLLCGALPTRTRPSVDPFAPSILHEDPPDRPVDRQVSLDGQKPTRATPQNDFKNFPTKEAYESCPITAIVYDGTPQNAADNSSNLHQQMQRVKPNVAPRTATGAYTAAHMHKHPYSQMHMHSPMLASTAGSRPIALPSAAAGATPHYGPSTELSSYNSSELYSSEFGSSPMTPEFLRKKTEDMHKLWEEKLRKTTAAKTRQEQVLKSKQESMKILYGTAYNDSDSDNEPNHMASALSPLSRSRSNSSGSKKNASPPVPTSPNSSKPPLQESVRPFSISFVESVSSVDQDKITQRLQRLTKKKDLLEELSSSLERVEDKLLGHEERVAKLRKELMKVAMDYRHDKTLWKQYCVIDLQDLCEQYYKSFMKYYHEYIALEMLYVDCCKAKKERLNTTHRRVSKNIHGWAIEDVRADIDATIQTVFRIRVSRDVKPKAALVDKIRMESEQFSRTYEIKKQLLGGKDINMERRSKEVIRFLANVLDKRAQFYKAAAARSLDCRITMVTEDEFYFSVVSGSGIREFTSFIMDQRLIEGKTVDKFFRHCEQNHANVSLEELYEFCEKILDSFIFHTYGLDQIFPSNQIQDVGVAVRLLIYRSLIFGQTTLRDSVNAWLNQPRGEHEMKQLQKSSKYAYFCKKIYRLMESKV